MQREVVIENRRAKHQFAIIEQLEAGIRLTGSEVKSLRSGQVDIAQAYATTKGTGAAIEVFLKNAYFAPWTAASKWAQHAPTRDRKLLLHRKEIHKIFGKSRIVGMTLVPLKMYFNSRGKAKLLLGLAKGRRKVDKRHAIKERDWSRRKQRLLCTVLLGILTASQSFGQLARADTAFAEYKRALAQQAFVTHAIPLETSLAYLGSIAAPDEVIYEKQENQPEFIYSYRHYLKQRTTLPRVLAGRASFAKNKRLFAEVEARYRIDKYVLLALWGIETSYGANTGRHEILSSLVTAGFQKNRAEFYQKQAVGALFVLTQLAKAGKSDSVHTLKGSWAGASGHFQFIPTTWIHYQRDWNQDGFSDIWNNLGDAASSAAYYLSQTGWKASERWGRRVLGGTDLIEIADLIDVTMRLPQWQEKGFRLASGSPLPADPTTEATLIAPEGVMGPLYLVYRNFYTLLRWNRSVHFALTVCHLSELLQGQDSRPELENILKPITRERIKQSQSRLIALGYYEGDVDGRVGRGTRQALIRWQRDYGMPADGFLNEETVRTLLQS